MATNLNWAVDYDPEKLTADLVWAGRPWALGTGDGSSSANWAPVDANGWPSVSAGTGFGCIFDSNPWVGTYKLTFKNQNGADSYTVTSYSGSFISIGSRTYDSGTDTVSYTITVSQYEAGSFIWLRWASATGTGIYDVHLMRPLKDASGHHAIGTPLSDYIVDRLAWFGTIRTMQFGGGVGSGLTTGTYTSWSTRTKPYSVQTRGSDVRIGGVAIENLCATANQVQKDLWVNVPFYATDDYILGMARTIAFGSDGTTAYTSTQASPVFPPLDANLKVYVEHGNEIWNSGAGYPGNANYTINNADIAAGDPNKTTYDGTGGAWDWSWRRVGWLAVRHSLIFRGVFGNAAMMTRVRPILASQHGRYATTSNPMYYIRDVWGTGSVFNNSGTAFDTINGVTNPRQPTNYYIYALATAPYVPDGNEGLDVTSAATMLSSTYTNLTQNAAGKILNAMTWNHDIAAAQGIEYVAYEGGNNLLPELMHSTPNGDATTAYDQQTTEVRALWVQRAKDASFDPTIGATMGASITGGVPDANQTGYIYGTLLKEWRARGGGLFCHFTLGEYWGAGSMFGLCAPSTESSSDPRYEIGPKWDAIKAYSGT
jgi:hypothetical protein